MMRKKSKTFMIAVTMAILLSIFASWILNMELNGNYSRAGDFYGASKEVSLEEMTEIADIKNISIYLPSTLPNNLTMTAIYLQEAPFIVIVVYSAEGNKDYKTAELGIQLTQIPSEFIPTYEQLKSQVEYSEFESALEINGWPVKVNEKASSGGDPEFREKYGDYTLLVWVWIEEVGYTICAPTLGTEEAVQLVGSMILITS